MDEPTRQELLELNRRFYRRHARAFSASREAPWDGWRRILTLLPDTGTLRVLDLGCGNARFAGFLRRHFPRPFEYLGIDQSSELLEEAELRWCRGDAREGTRLDVVQGELTAAAWSGLVPERRFDLVVLFGVLHHVPSREGRLRILERGLGHLAKNGLMAASIWRFDRQRNFERKVLAWERYNRTAQRPIDTTQLEPGDFLLTWAGDSETPRYCHRMDRAEQETLARTLGAAERYHADGPSGEDNLYLIFRGSRAVLESGGFLPEGAGKKGPTP